jgi:excinuclease ABC subunit C
MDLAQKIRSIPTEPGVYLYKNAEGEVIYVGKAKNLRSRVASYFHEGRWEDAKTGSLVREAVDVDYIVVGNNKEALALENNLIKQRKPRFNILLRDDKTYLFVTRRLRKDGSAYYGPYFPANLAYRIVDLIHRNFLIPSCKVDLTRFHPRPCLQYYIKRCLGPCVQALTTPDAYQEAVRDVKLFLEGRPTDLSKSLRQRMEQAAAAQEYERAARYRDLISTVEQLQERQRIAAAEGDDADVFGYHYENGMLAVNLFHMRGGRVVDRREFFWEDLPEFGASENAEVPLDHGAADALVRPEGQSSARADDPADQSEQHATLASLADGRMRPSLHADFNPSEFFSALLTQLYIGQPYVPRNLYVPVDFEDRETLEDLLSEKFAGEGARATRVHILVPQRGDKRALIDLAGTNAKQSYDQRFRVLKPNAKAIQEELQDVLGLSELPKRIECFDISHIQGAETVASMVVWEDGKMKKSDYRKFIIRTVEGVDDFASMREVVTRRYKRVQQEDKPMPSLVLVDGGLGQLHAAAEALESLEIINQPLAAIAKREEILYVYGQEKDPIALDHHSPVLHLIQQIRDEAHRFAVTFHRKRRQMRDRSTELLEIPGVGESTTRRLLEHFGSLQAVKQADAAALSAVVTRGQAEAISSHFRK